MKKVLSLTLVLMLLLATVAFADTEPAEVL